MHIAADYPSGGEQQMVAVARALSGNVKLLPLRRGRSISFGSPDRS